VTHDHAPGEACPSCWAELSTPLFCESCHELLDHESPSPFDALGVPPEFPIDAMALRKRLLALSRRMHPDLHGTADEATRTRAERNTAELNAAFEILSDDFRRADWLVKSLDGPTEKEERQMPPAFLAEVLEWSEAIEEARGAAPGSDARAGLEPLEETLRAERAKAMAEVSRQLTPLPELHAPELVDVRRLLNTIRYLDRTLKEIAELRLEQASSTP
jgi:molecular chaperone HscB